MKYSHNTGQRKKVKADVLKIKFIQINKIRFATHC
jgi:hypothetical protein